MEHDYSRGTYFAENSHPTVKGKVILAETDELPGVGHAYRLAEKATGGEHEGQWFAYWQPAQQLHDEVALGSCDQRGTLDEARLAEVEEHVSISAPEPADAPEGVNLDAPRVSDVMPSFTDYHTLE